MTADLAHDAILSRLGAVVPVLSRSLRAQFVAAPGRKFVSADFSGIEGRINAWTAGEEWKLQAFRDYDAGVGPNLYNLAYARAFGVPAESVRKGSIEYDIGKKAELACLAGDQLIRTDRGLVPIEHVTTQHRVWDGWKFVTHGGVVARGTRAIVEFGGLRATPDHLVWNHERAGWSSEPVPFGELATQHESPRAWAATPTPQQIVHVFDILDCGPRHSFVTANGWRCHNCGYQGSVGAYLRFSPNVAPIARAVREKFHGGDAWRLAREQFDRATSHHGLGADEWISVKVVVNGWREANGRIVQGWWDRQDAAVTAVDQPGARIDLFGGKVSYLVAEGFLWCRLPTGKLLAYCRPRLVETRDDFLVDADGELIALDELGEDEVARRVAAGATVREGRVRTQVQFDGTNQKTRQWGPQRLYGGLQCNNDTQAIARELLRMAMHRIEDAGYPVVLHVHDELVSEIAQEFGSAEHYESLMSVLPPGFEGLPLAASAWSDQRYVK